MINNNAEIQNTIDRCLETLLDWERRNEIIDLVGKEISKLNVEDLPQDVLYKVGQKLAVLQFNLSDIYIESKMEYNTTYCFRKFDSAVHYLSLSDGTQKQKEALATKHVQDTYKNEIYKNLKAEKLSYLYRNVDRLISLLQTRISMLKSQQFQSNVQEG